MSTVLGEALSPPRFHSGKSPSSSPPPVAAGGGSAALGGSAAADFAGVGGGAAPSGGARSAGGSAARSAFEPQPSRSAAADASAEWRRNRRRFICASRYHVCTRGPAARPAP